MDASETENKQLENTQEAESISVDEFVRESVKEKNSNPAEDFAAEDHENSEKLDVGLDPVTETELSLDSSKPVESLSEEFLTQTTENPVEIEQSLGDTNGVSEAVIDFASNEIDSVSGQNGYFDPTPSQVSEAVEPALDETNYEVSSKETTLSDSGAVDLVSNPIINSVSKSVVVEQTDVPEVPHSTENRAYISVTPLPLQRTSWRDCCGLFKILRRSDE
jgi:hypothetical protein